VCSLKNVPLTTSLMFKMLLEHLEVTRDLFPIANNTRVSLDRILYQLIPASQQAVEHELLAAHWWPANKCCIRLVNITLEVRCG
jgi:hypothetical protein